LPLSEPCFGVQRHLAATHGDPPTESGPPTETAGGPDVPGSNVPG